MAKEESSNEAEDRSKETDTGYTGWGGWSSSSWYARPTWSSWSWSYPSYGYSGYSGYSNYGYSWARPDWDLETKQDDSQSRQERWSQAWSQALAKDRQEAQKEIPETPADWWRSERPEREEPKVENLVPESKQDVEGPELKWVPPTARVGSQETSSATTQETQQARIGNRSIPQNESRLLEIARVAPF